MTDQELKDEILKLILAEKIIASDNLLDNT